MSTIIIIFTIIAYMCFVLYVRVMIGRKIKNNSNSLYLGNRGMGPIVTAMSAEASDMSAFLFMGIPGLAYATGFASITWISISLAIGTFLNFLLIAGRLCRYSKRIEAVNIADFFAKRFGSNKKLIENLTAIILLFFTIPYIASGLSAIGRLMSSLSPNFTYVLGVVVGAIIIVLYTSIAGFGSVAVFDLMQSIMMSFSLTIIVFYAIKKVGGWSVVIEYVKLLPGFLHLTQVYNVDLNEAERLGFFEILSKLSWGLGYFGMPHILVHFMSIRHENELSISRNIATMWVVISMAIAILTGVVGLSVSHLGYIEELENIDVENIVVLLAKLFADDGILFFASIVSGIVLAGIFAAFMTTADSQLTCATSAFIKNIIEDFFKLRLEGKKRIIYSRIFVIVLVVISMYFASYKEIKVFDAVSFAWAGLGACFGPIMLLALFYKKTKSVGVISGMISAFLTVFIWRNINISLAGIFDVYELFPAFVINIIVTIIVSNLSKERNNEVEEIFDEVVGSI